MKIYTVCGTVTCNVSIEISANDEDEAIAKAAEEFGGIESYCGNNGIDKLIGVNGKNESIECCEDPVFTYATDTGEEVDDEDEDDE